MHRKINEEFQLGVPTRVLVDLTKSRNKENRYYSIKQKVDRGRGKQWYRVATLQRFTLESVSFKIKREGSKSRASILKSGVKDVHAYIEGVITTLVDNDDEHSVRINEDNQRYVSYDPFRCNDFLVSQQLHLPKQCEGLDAAEDGADVYCFERSIQYTAARKQFDLLG